MSKDKHMVFAFGRMNPPTAGHSKLVDKVHSVARQNKADHRVIVSHSQDKYKNPLSSSQKIRYLKHVHPQGKFEGSSKSSPNFFSHLSKMHQEGHTHVTMVAGSDRVHEFQKLADKYNGKKGTHGYYKFKHLKVVSAGARDPDATGVAGISGTKMRTHASNNDYKSFKSGLHHKTSHGEAKKLFNATRSGMGLKEGQRRLSFGLFLKETNNAKNR